MMYSIVLKKSAQKELSKLPTTIVKKIAAVIDDLASNPRPVGAKKLEAQKNELWRVRTGDYRIVYSIYSGAIKKIAANQSSKILLLY